MKLIVGLGNPGKEYGKTRHNIGFRIVNAVAAKLGIMEWKFSEKFQAEISEHDGALFVKPQTFMNLSGKSAAALVNFYKLDPAKDLLVIADDKDMVFGKLRLRGFGSSGGHKGLQSIIESIGTKQFHRLKVGVGHEDQRVPTDAFVLQKFSKEEEKAIPTMVEDSVKKILAWLPPKG